MIPMVRRNDLTMIHDNTLSGGSWETVAMTAGATMCMYSKIVWMCNPHSWLLCSRPAGTESINGPGQAIQMAVDKHSRGCDVWAHIIFDKYIICICMHQKIWVLHVSCISIRKISCLKSCSMQWHGKCWQLSSLQMTNVQKDVQTTVDLQCVKQCPPRSVVCVVPCHPDGWSWRTLCANLLPWEWCLQKTSTAYLPCQVLEAQL